MATDLLPRRRFLRAAVWLSGSSLAAVLAGCGSTAKIQQQDSVGQQLLDLEESYSKGVITKKEYERLKKAIIRNND